MTISYTNADRTQSEENRPLAPALTRGAKLRCPSCGEGKLFSAYLKVSDSCDHCGQELHHHRADDAPPYITIVIVGHLLVGLMLHLEMAWHVNPQVYLYTLVPLSIILPLAILPSVKGMIVGLQWAFRMHGFGKPDPYETMN